MNKTTMHSFIQKLKASALRLHPFWIKFIAWSKVYLLKSTSWIKAFLQTKKGLRVFIASMALLFLLWLIPPVYLLKLGSSITATHWEKKKGRVTVEVGPKESSWIAINKASRHALFAIVVSEDSRFFEHWGLDFKEIWTSFELNLKKGRYARGASTITQQVVRLAFLEKQKNILRKGREALGAFLLELIMNKEDILEWYINLVDFGDGIYGLKSASRHYFSTRPEALTISQGVHLALVLPSPNAWSVGLRRHNLTNFGHRRFAKILLFLLQNGYITRVQWEQTLAAGNFGSPIQSHSSKMRLAKTKQVKKDPVASDDGEGEDEETEEEAEGEEELNTADHELTDPKDPKTQTPLSPSP